jgi:hypothetical protein
MTSISPLLSWANCWWDSSLESRLMKKLLRDFPAASQSSIQMNSRTKAVIAHSRTLLLVNALSNYHEFPSDATFSLAA